MNHAMLAWLRLNFLRLKKVCFPGDGLTGRKPGGGLAGAKTGAGPAGGSQPASGVVYETANIAGLKAAVAKMRDKLSADVEQLNKVADSLKASSQIIAAANDVLSQRIADRVAGVETEASVLQQPEVPEADTGSLAGHKAEVVQLTVFRQAKKTQAKAGRNSPDFA